MLNFRSANYDWDDNVFFMTTSIVVFHKTLRSGPLAEVAVSTGGFARLDGQVGKVPYPFFVKELNGKTVEAKATDENAIEIDMQDYELLALTPGQEDRFSFREFRSVEGGVNYFLNDLKEAIENKWFGPAWDDFKTDCSTRHGADHVRVVTARGNSADDIYEGMLFLQAVGEINFLPLRENIFPVNWEGLPEQFKDQNTEEAKLKVLLDSLDSIERAAELSGHEEVFVEFEFSDDRTKTIDHAEKAIQELINEGRWPKVSIHLVHTGDNMKNVKKLVSESLVAG